MITEEIKINLCHYDPENPINNLEAFDETDCPQPRNGCACDNCFYGRDALAVQILNTQRELTAERALANRLAGCLNGLWNNQPLHGSDYDVILPALAAWKEARDTPEVANKPQK